MSKNKRHHHHPAAQGEEAASETADQQTQRLAYHYWEQRGCPEGTPETDWYQAEQELARQREAATRL